MVKEYKMEVTKNDGSVFGDARMGVKDGIWTISYVFEPKMDMTLLALIKHDLDDGDILEHTANFYFGWYGFDEAKKWCKDLIRKIDADVVFDEDKKDEDMKKDDVKPTWELNDIVEFIKGNNFDEALKIIENDGWELSEIYNELYASSMYQPLSEFEKFVVENDSEKSIVDASDEKSIVDDSNEDLDEDEYMKKIIDLIDAYDVSYAVTLMENGNILMDDVEDALRTNRQYEYMGRLQKFMAIKEIKKMIDKMEHRKLTHSEIVVEDDFWGDGVAEALCYSKLTLPFNGSFDELDDGWIMDSGNRNAFTQWLKDLVIELEDNPVTRVVKDTKSLDSNGITKIVIDGEEWTVEYSKGWDKVFVYILDADWQGKNYTTFFWEVDKLGDLLDKVEEYIKSK